MLALGGCATLARPVNAPITQTDPSTGYRFELRQSRTKDKDNLVILAFSGGGTRAAAFSFGVLEFLRSAEVAGPRGQSVRLLDEVDIITGVSGGSVTALAYGLHGERLFTDYDNRFLKRNFQGELIARGLNPLNWGNLWWTRWGRSEMSASLFDELLFGGATFADLERGSGPLILISATDISTGARFVFHQGVFDLLCSDLGAVPLSRAAAASSAVPVLLSPVTLNNYGGTCNMKPPAWVNSIADAPERTRSAARALRTLESLQDFGDGANRPYLHLVDGGVSDNVGMRGVLDALELMEANHDHGIPTPLDKARRIVVFIVNSMSTPRTNWDHAEVPPGALQILLKASGVPIDHYSYESVELLRDRAARWRTMRRIRQLTAGNSNPALAAALRTPNAEIYAIDVSFPALKDQAELEYLNGLPTSFSLPAEAVDRLRAAAGTIIRESPEFNRLLRDVRGTLSPAEP